MARCSRPTPVRDQGGVGWFVYCVKEIHLSTCTTNIFWLCRSVNGKAHQPEVLLVNRRDFSHFDFVFPSVTEVVFVDEGIAPVGGDRFKSHGFLILEVLGMVKFIGAQYFAEDSTNIYVHG